MAFTVEFAPWPPFRAKKNQATIHNWLEEIGRASEDAFKRGASRPWPGSGPWDFETPGAPPGEWPMRRSGTLIGSISHETDADSVTVGSGAISPKGFDYSSWLQKTGRKMSKEALEEGTKASHLARWVEWSKI